MFFIIGVVVVFGSVIGGYMGAGGHLDVLWQPFEVVIIFGAGIGAFIISNPKPVLGGTAKVMGPLLRGGSKYNKENCMELLGILYALFKLAKTKGDLMRCSSWRKPRVTWRWKRTWRVPRRARSSNNSRPSRKIITRSNSCATTSAC